MVWESKEIHKFKDHFFEVMLFRGRILFSFIVVCILFLILFFRFYKLQILEHDIYATRADSNRIHIRPIAPNRGLIFDSSGMLLADNQPSFTLYVVKERAGDLDKLMVQLSNIINIDESDKQRFEKLLKRRRRPYERVPLRFSLTEEEIAKIAVSEYELKGVKVDAELVRYYPEKELYAHTLGYVGRINPKELEGFNEEEEKQYQGSHHIGKIGLEKYYEAHLLGSPGVEFIETNAHGRVLRTLDRVDPVPGKNIHLYLKDDLQKEAFAALNDRRGAVVAMDVKTGGVLAMVSTPSFDPNLFVRGISHADYNALNQSLDLPLYNRTLQAQYPPGSTLKPVLGLAGLDSKIIDKETFISDPGFFKLENDKRLYRDWKPYGHGKHVDLHQAIVESCDTFFYNLANLMGVDLMHTAGAKFGLGARTGIDIPNERRGLWPSREWKKRERGIVWYPGDNLNMSIGQGAVLTTPLQLAVMVTSVANRGRTLVPKLMRQMDDTIFEAETLSTYIGAEENWEHIHQSMQDVMHTRKGTANSVGKKAEYKIAGKTGTAQVVGIAQGEKYDSEALEERKRDHALFVGFAPADEPKIAVAVILENGEKSSKAAKVAKQVMDKALLPLILPVSAPDALTQIQQNE